MPLIYIAGTEFAPVTLAHMFFTKYVYFKISSVCIFGLNIKILKENFFFLKRLSVFEFKFLFLNKTNLS